MQDRPKQVDVRVGSFACSIQGYDDPVGLLARLLDVARRGTEPVAALDEEAVARALAAAAAGTGLDPDRLEAAPGFIVTVAAVTATDAVEEETAVAVVEAAETETVPTKTDISSDQAQSDPEQSDPEAGTEEVEAEGEAVAAEAASRRVDAEMGAEIRRALEMAVGPGMMEPPARREREPRFAAAWDRPSRFDPPTTPPGVEETAEAPIRLRPMAEPAPEEESDAPPVPLSAGDRMFAAGAMDEEDEDEDDEPPLLLAAEFEAVPEEAPATGDEGEPGSRRRRRGIFSEEEPVVAPAGPAADDAFLARLNASRFGGAGETGDRQRRPKPPLTPQALSWKMNARKPDEQILCACAFLTFSEKKPRFSRRDVWRVLDQIPGEVVRNLEVRVRAFGRFVRDGVVIQHGGDSFSLSDVEMDRVADYFDD